MGRVFRFPILLGGSTMFDQLHPSPAAVARYGGAPLLEERLAYVTHLADQGYAWDSLRQTASDLLLIVKMLGLSNPPRKAVTRDEVERKVANPPRLRWLAVRWLKFMGRLRQRAAPANPCAKKIKAFADYMEHEAELSRVTVVTRSWFVTRLLDRLDVKGGSLHEITPRRIDMAFQKLLEPGGYSRATVQTCPGVLRAFFRFAETRGWCRKGLAASIHVRGSTRRHRYAGAVVGRRAAVPRPDRRR